jgi:hypothetical protein
MLRQTKNGTSLAKLTKELIKLADSYKVLELKFDEQAGKRRFNYQAWLMKLQPILAMFWQISSVVPKDKVIPFEDPNAIGNRALYLLISSWTDSYFQRAIRQFEPFGDKALELLQEQYAHMHQRLGHWKCHALLAASEHGVWEDTIICMGPEQECISCDISTARGPLAETKRHTLVALMPANTSF